VASSSECVHPRLEVCRDAVGTADRSDVPDETDPPAPRRRRNRRNAELSDAGPIEPARAEGSDSAGSACAERDAPEPFVTKAADIIRWYLPQPGASHERVLELQALLRRYKGSLQSGRIR